VAEGRYLAPPEIPTDYEADVRTAFSLSEDSNTIQGAYGVLSMNVRVQTPGEKVRLEIFARNLTDKHWASFIYPSSVQSGSPTQVAGYSQFFPEAARRIVGVALSGKF
jgi:iron complex outermembrane receptor protein